MANEERSYLETTTNEVVSRHINQHPDQLDAGPTVPPSKQPNTSECRHCISSHGGLVCNCGCTHNEHVLFLGCRNCSSCPGYSQTLLNRGAVDHSSEEGRVRGKTMVTKEKGENISGPNQGFYCVAVQIDRAGLAPEGTMGELDQLLFIVCEDGETALRTAVTAILQGDSPAAPIKLGDTIVVGYKCLAKGPITEAQRIKLRDELKVDVQEFTGPLRVLYTGRMDKRGFPFVKHLDHHLGKCQINNPHLLAECRDYVG